MSLETLERAAVNTADPDRDPFRFAAYPVSLRSRVAGQQGVSTPTVFLPLASIPAGPASPLLPWKLTAIVQRGATRWAVFSDCRGIPATIPEGGSLMGKWVVTRIATESVTIRSVDDRSTTLPLLGCDPR